MGILVIQKFHTHGLLVLTGERDDLIIESVSCIGSRSSASDGVWLSTFQIFLSEFTSKPVELQAARTEPQS